MRPCLFSRVRSAVSEPSKESRFNIGDHKHPLLIGATAAADYISCEFERIGRCAALPEARQGLVIMCTGYGHDCYK